MNKTQAVGRLARGLCAVGLAVGLQTAQAAPAWQINTNGSGLPGATPIAANANVSGVGFVQAGPNPANQSQYVFVEHGAYQLLNSSANGPFGGKDITVVYSVSGNLSAQMAPSFSNGNIKLFADSNLDFGSAAGNYGADNGTLLASFSVTGGGAVSNTAVALQAHLDPNSLLRGYLFDAYGNDMADARGVILDLIVNNQMGNPDNLQVSEIVCGLAGYTGAGCNNTPFSNMYPFAYFVEDGGTVALTAVPEPGSMALLGVALGGLSLIRRRKSMR
nr:flocculation-associated PEP-CTERM protein PepA [Dechloromonas sp.]